MKVDRSKPARPTLLHVDLKDLKAPWSDWCASRNLTPSEAVRRVLRTVLSTDPVADPPLKEDDESDGEGTGNRRLQVTLTTAEHAALVALAAQEGMTVPRWLRGVVRLHLTGDRQFGEKEIEALARSNQVLLALARNINQIGRNLSARTNSDVLTLAQIEFLIEQLKSHTEAVGALLNANEARWRR